MYLDQNSNHASASSSKRVVGLIATVASKLFSLEMAMQG